MNAEKIKTLIEEALSEDTSLFLIDWKIKDDNRILIILDGDNGVTIEQIMALSRHVEHNLDREEEDFSLDVMSAGADSPLMMRRQYVKNMGRELRVKVRGGEIIEGELVAADGDDATGDQAGISLQWEVREPKPIGKGKCTVVKDARVPYNEIEQAKVIITF